MESLVIAPSLKDSCVVVDHTLLNLCHKITLLSKLEVLYLALIMVLLYQVIMWIQLMPTLILLAQLVNLKSLTSVSLVSHATVAATVQTQA